MSRDQGDRTVGSVLVVGGGIGGIQSALDLAESGYYVYLVEKSPTIGGAMAQLDKTFPTNDCAMCILGPKLVECARHLNIENLTYSEFIGLSGEPGNYTARIRENPSYVDSEACTGCGDCADVCPVTTFSRYDEELAEQNAIYRPFPQASPNVFTIAKEPEHRLCELSCPAGCDAQGYIALTGEGKYREAMSLIKQTVPLPGTMGRICVHPCETNCRRAAQDEPVSVSGLKRFVADQVDVSDVHPDTQQVEEPQKVAVVGSGPAGLSCAYYLALMGHRPTVFESQPVAGGMLALGIPEYRLPHDVLQDEIKAIEEVGVEIKTNSPIGGDYGLADVLSDGYEAAFVAVGAQQGRSLGLDGEEAEGVMQGVDFLRQVNLLQREHGSDAPELKDLVGESVAVIGGGNVAMDAARTAVRMGASEVRVLYRRSQAEMPALLEEAEAAVEEGVMIEFLTNPSEVVVEDGQAVALRCMRMRLGSPDDSGRRRPEPIEGSEYLLQVDTVVPCIGQSVDLSALSGSSVEDDGWTIEVDPETLATSQEGVFAGGDATTGPAIAVDAMADGRRAAESIRRYLAGEEISGDRPQKPQADPALDEIPRGMPTEPRMTPNELPADSRIESFGEVNCGYDETSARQEAERCLQCAICSECLECLEACEAEAINHEQEPVFRDVDVGAVVLSPGFDEFEPEEIYEYGYGRIDNVVTSIEFERILSANGPTAGDLVRPSDGEHPEKIAWIQCIGSRDEQVGCGYCSSVCCTYAIKEAEIAKEHSSDPLHTTIFFMDMRTYGKDFERYYQRSIDDYDVDYVRSRVQQVSERPDGTVVLRYASEDGEVHDEAFDMVVLSVGLRPPRAGDDLASITQISRDEYGFAAHRDFQPVATTREGIFSSGVFGGPKDIPETVMEASAAAGEVSAMLSGARDTATRDKEYPPEISVEGQPPRVGVFVCHCGINIGGVVDVPKVKEFAAELPYVTLAEENLYTCSQDTQELIKEKIQEHDLNRIVVASCTPRTHEPLFQETIREAGLNPYLFHMANIRDQCSWVHSEEPQAATEKACSLVQAAIAKAVRLQPLPEVSVQVTKSALVIGGGPSGMVSALNLARQGFEVHLVERTDQLGGNARHLTSTLQGQDVPGHLQQLIDQVTEEALISVYTESEVVEAEGYVGNFHSTVRSANGSTRGIEHGAVIIAVGGQQYEPESGEFGFGQHPGVMSCREMEQALESGSEQLNQADELAIIHCVGSRDDDHPYCSRVCCSQAIKVALKMKRKYPKKEIHLLYRDVRAYGFSEKQYREARKLGVNFVRYHEESEPEVLVDGDELRVKVEDRILGQTITLRTDVVGLSCGVLPSEGVHHLSQLYKVPLNDDNFFLEAHVKLRPVDFATDGVFLAGLAHAPKLLSESIAQAQAAAGRASTLLSKDELVVEGWAAEVDEQMCSGCETCVQICPYSAIDMDEDAGVAQVNEVLCKGCGACTVACRSGAIDTRGFTNQQVLEEVEAACLRVSD